jgi:hypothetical protein
LRNPGLIKVLVVVLAAVGLLIVIQWAVLYKDVSSGKIKTGTIQKIDNQILPIGRSGQDAS